MAKALKILVLSESYPNQNGHLMAFVHTRNLYYLKRGHQIDVLCFDAASGYQLEGVSVLTEADLVKNEKIEEFDIVVSHAPNLRNHIRFILKNKKQIQKIVFVIHGHEVLQKSNYYPKPYPNLQSTESWFSKVVDEVYDMIKLKALHFLFTSVLKTKAHFIFVSEWMKQEFIENINMDPEVVQTRSKVIPNSIHSVFENNAFDFDRKKDAHFITIRNFDSPKYGIDLIVKAAVENPESEFHLYGKGSFFKHYDQPKNLKVIEVSFRHEEMLDLLNRYQAALMPTRLDSQGVMACEMASFGIPLVTSNLSICREIFQGFGNVELIANESFEFKAQDFLKSAKKENFVKNKKFYSENTVQQELEYFDELVAKK